MRKYLGARLPLLLILSAFVVGALAHQLTMPVMEGSDEHLHTLYALFLHAENRLPDRASYFTNPTRQESGQPPFTYWIGVLALRLFNYPPLDPEQAAEHVDDSRNLWLSPPNPWRQNDNLNHLIHGPNEVAFGAPELVAANRLLRLTALLFGVLAVVGAYHAANEVFAEKKWALIATTLFAFTPTMVHLAGYFNNDISAAAFTTLAIWKTLALVRKGATPGRLVLIGLLLALAALSKVSALLVAPGIGLALVLDWRKRGISFGRLVVNGLILSLPLFLLFLPWIIYGVVTYNDPFGFRTHNDPRFRHDPLLPPWGTLRYMPEIYLSYWAKFGLAKVYLDPIIYTLLGVIPALALIGWLVGARRLDWKSVRVQQVLVLATVALVVFAGLVRWLQEAIFITGRLVYPAHAAITLLLIMGLRRFVCRFPRLDFSTRAYTVGLVMLAGVILAPVSLYSAYSMPLSRDAL